MPRLPGSRCARSRPNPPPRCSPWPARCGISSTTPASDAARASSAAAASSPSALTSRMVPAVAPRPSTLRMLLASASRPFAATMILDRKRIAVRTNSAAGRACNATPSGRVMVASEVASIARLLRGAGHLLEGCSRRGDDRCSDRTFDEWRVDQPEVPVAISAKDFTDGEYRAAEVAEEQDSLSLVGLRHGLADERLRGPQASVRAAPGRLDVQL